MEGHKAKECEKKYRKRLGKLIPTTSRTSDEAVTQSTTWNLTDKEEILKLVERSNKGILLPSHDQSSKLHELLGTDPKVNSTNLHVSHNRLRTANQLGKTPVGEDVVDFYMDLLNRRGQWPQGGFNVSAMASYFIGD